MNDSLWNWKEIHSIRFGGKCNVTDLDLLTASFVCLTLYGFYVLLSPAYPFSVHIKPSNIYIFYVGIGYLLALSSFFFLAWIYKIKLLFNISLYIVVLIAIHFYNVIFHLHQIILLFYCITQITHSNYMTKKNNV